MFKKSSLWGEGGEDKDGPESSLCLSFYFEIWKLWMFTYLKHPVKQKKKKNPNLKIKNKWEQTKNLKICVKVSTT